MNQNLIPAFIDLTSNPMRVSWIERKGRFFRQPFFRDSLDRSDFSPDAFRPLSELTPTPQKKPYKPDGFIFHVGRCGSTLLSNMLMLDEANLVLSEPDPLTTSFLLTEEEVSDREHVFVNALETYASSRLPNESRVFVKFSSISVLFLERILKLYPDVPWVFVYREPIYILSSQFLRPPSWVREIDRLLLAAGLAPREHSSLKSAISAQVRILGAEFSAAQKLISRGGLILSYDEIKRGWPQKVADHFGYDLPASAKTQIPTLLRSYSKAPTGTVEFNEKAEVFRTPILDESSLPNLEVVNALYQHFEREIVELK